MRVVVIGAGIIGVTTAYYLRRHGLEVTVLERHAGVAQEASFANAGVIAPAYVTPWAKPGMPGKLLRRLLRADSPVILRPTLEPAFWRWLRRWVDECTVERFRMNKARMQRIAAYSLFELTALRERYELDYEQAQGYLQLFRSQEELDQHAPARALLTEAGLAFRLLDAEGCRELEPALNAEVPLAGGVYLPNDETGNCAYFTRRLREIGEQDGVQYRFGCHVQQLHMQDGRLSAVQTNTDTVPADAVVIAAGVDSTALLQPIGIDLPLYPVKGFSATVSLRQYELAPSISVMDETYKIAITRLGKRLRIAGLAELGPRELIMRVDAAKKLIDVASSWFPAAATYGSAQYWVGARPMLPDGAPLLGATPIRGVYLNLGHGSSGWAMACGSASVVADLIVGNTPAIDLDGLTLARYGHTPNPGRATDALGATA